MAHGQDVRNAVATRADPRARPRSSPARAHTVIFNSAYLRDQMPVPVQRARGDRPRRRPGARSAADQAARRRLGRRRPVFLFAGSLIERKNVVRLRDAFEALGRGTLVVLGDGPLRAELEGRAASGCSAASRTTRSPRATSPPPTRSSSRASRSRSARRCSRRWPSERSVVATNVGGPPEFVTPEAGALVDPLSVDSIRAGARARRRAPDAEPEGPRGRRAHAIARQVDRMEAVLRAAAARLSARRRHSPGREGCADGDTALPTRHYDRGTPQRYEA